MALNLRQSDILEIARSEGKVVVEDLAERFSVTVQTIRRDLADLAESGRLERVHGGAVLPSGASNIGYEDRRGLNTGEKAAIGRACAAALPHSCSIFLDIGTSTEAVARALQGHADLMVATNNLNVANILVANPTCRIVVTGGQLRRADGGLVGEIAAQVIDQFKFDYAVISCSAIDDDGDLLDFDVQEVSVLKRILQRARRSYLVADHSKFARSAPARIASLAEIDRVFTDRPLAEPLVARCAGWDTEVVVAA